MDLADHVADLYALPPGEFTGARDALAKRLRTDGEKEAADQVKALRRPTLAAWIANLLVREHPDCLDRMRQLGADLREALAAQDADRLRELTRERHDLKSALLQTAQETSRRHDQSVSTTVARRLEETIDAAIVDPAAADLLATRRLSSALQHVGFGVVDEQGEPAAVVSLAAVRARRDSRQRRRDSALERAEATADEAEQATERLEVAATELREADRQVNDAQAEVARITDQLEAAREELHHAQSRRDMVARTHRRAERAADQARRKAEQAQGELDALGE
jgi:hypothetical protein